MVKCARRRRARRLWWKSRRRRAGGAPRGGGARVRTCAVGWDAPTTAPKSVDAGCCSRLSQRCNTRATQMRGDHTKATRAIAWGASSLPSPPDSVGLPGNGGLPGAARAPGERVVEVAAVRVARARGAVRRVVEFARAAEGRLRQRAGHGVAAEVVAGVEGLAGGERVAREAQGRVPRRVVAPAAAAPEAAERAVEEAVERAVPRAAQAVERAVEEAVERAVEGARGRVAVGAVAGRGPPAPGPAWKSNLQPDVNVRVIERIAPESSAELRELDESNRFVQKSAESTSI